MKKSVFSIVRDHHQANVIAEQLLNAGFTKDDVSILYSEKNTIVNVSPLTGETTIESSSEGQKMGHVKETKAPEGATTGALAGGVIGGAIGLLAGIGTLAIPGLGPFIAAGPIMASLSGLAIGGGVGMVTGALVGMGIPEYEAKRYQDYLSKGKVLMAVHADTSEQIDTIKALFKQYGGEDIAVSTEEKIDTQDRRGRAVDVDPARPPFVTSKDYDEKEPRTF